MHSSLVSCPLNVVVVKVGIDGDGRRVLYEGECGSRTWMATSGYQALRMRNLTIKGASTDGMSTIRKLLVNLMTIFWETKVRDRSYFVNVRHTFEDILRHLHQCG